jgi:carbon monoxide dehydrogenase subunit G
MKLEGTVTIRRTPEDVWKYLGDVSKVSEWDRGVASTRATNSNAPGVGFEFDTVAHPGARGYGGERGKMSYRISDADPSRGCTVELTNRDGNARFFTEAEWKFNVETVPEGARVVCAAHFKLRFPYIVLAPVFYGMNRAIQSDLEHLRRVLEQGEQ